MFDGNRGPRACMSGMPLTCLTPPTRLTGATTTTTAMTTTQAYGMMGWRIGYVAFPDYAHTNPDVPGEAPPSSSSSSSSNGSGQQPLTAPGALAMAQLKVGAGRQGAGNRGLKAGVQEDPCVGQCGLHAGLLVLRTTRYRHAALHADPGFPLTRCSHLTSALHTRDLITPFST